MIDEHKDDLAAAMENPNKLLEVRSDEELNSSVTMPGWMYVQIVERSRLEAYEWLKELVIRIQDAHMAYLIVEELECRLQGEEHH